MSLTEDEWAILDDVSDDWYGLWEVDWWFNAVHPDWPWQQRATYVVDLVQRGLLDVFSGRADDGVLEQDEALRIIKASSNWLPPSNDVQLAYHVSTTESGVAALKAERL